MGLLPLPEEDSYHLARGAEEVQARQSLIVGNSRKVNSLIIKYMLLVTVD